MVALSLPQNSSVQLRTSLLPQKTPNLNRALQLPLNDITLRGMRSKGTRVVRRICLAISEKESLGSMDAVAKNSSPIIVIDNYDSFTYNLCQYMGELGCNFEVYRNDELTVDELRKKNPRGILISPGPGAPQDSGISLQTVLELGPEVPLFGVCMGLQCIGEAFGGKVVRSPYGVMHGKSSLVYHNEGGEDGLFAGISNPFTVGRYHSLVIDRDTFPDVLEMTAWTEDGLVMAARHKVHRHLLGVQFHPESIITTEGKTIVSNFIKLIESKEAVSAPTPVQPLTQDDLKKLAADKAVEYVSSGMVLGLGTGSTAAFVVDKIGQLLASGQLTNIIGVPTSKRTQEQAASLGIPLSILDDHPKLDLAIDGADEVDPDLNLVKGRGGALLREKMVEAASDKFVVVVDDSKLVTGLGGSGLAMPVEVVQFCWKYNLVRLQELFKSEGCDAKLRLDGDGKPYVTDNMNYIVDLYFKTPIKDAWSAGKEISAFEGVVEHGLFLDMTTAVIIAGKDGVSVKSPLRSNQEWFVASFYILLSCWLVGGSWNV
ncbi:Ribose 5-phosphate isomerase, type A [Artemisia annua]|uniref:Ribose 5-phosphate isomerase, type A n=1 Tax=Artemisia annua TaxID=35608 RepID=A0A2U1MNN5_ARTAN|nr:Ribose 5-phosphate isomerase, type A [Artemisia annua]